MRRQKAKLNHYARQCAPAAPILAIGPDDRQSIAAGKWHSLTGIGEVIADQQEVCRKLGCAYWDLRARMGGAGSMRDWVYAGFLSPSCDTTASAAPSSISRSAVHP